MLPPAHPKLQPGRQATQAALCYGCSMPRKHTPKPDNAAQFKRFVVLAKEAGADADAKTFERAFKRVIRRPSPKAAPKGGS